MEKSDQFQVISAGPRTGLDVIKNVSTGNRILVFLPLYSHFSDWATWL